MGRGSAPPHDSVAKSAAAPSGPPSACVSTHVSPLVGQKSAHPLYCSLFLTFSSSLRLPPSPNNRRLLSLLLWAVVGIAVATAVSPVIARFDIHRNYNYATAPTTEGSGGSTSSVFKTDWIFTPHHSSSRPSNNLLSSSPQAPNRALEMGVSSVSLPLYGSVHATAYWFADLGFGTPSQQKQSLIVDTGSSVMGFPCSGCAEHCGSHIDAPFNVSDSTSVFPVACLQGCPLCSLADREALSAIAARAGNRGVAGGGRTLLISATQQQGQCAYHIKYTEGSSLLGRWFEDRVWLPARVNLKNTDNLMRRGGSGATTTSPSVPISVPFGCHVEETHLFVSQDASGILGLEATSRFGPPPFVTVVLAELLGLERKSAAIPDSAKSHGADGGSSATARDEKAGAARDLGISGDKSPASNANPIFAMCLSSQGGVLTVGEPNTVYHVKAEPPKDTHGMHSMDGAVNLITNTVIPSFVEVVKGSNTQKDNRNKATHPTSYYYVPPTSAGGTNTKIGLVTTPSFGTYNNNQEFIATYHAPTTISGTGASGSSSSQYGVIPSASSSFWSYGVSGNTHYDGTTSGTNSDTHNNYVSDNSWYTTNTHYSGASTTPTYKAVSGIESTPHYLETKKSRQYQRYTEPVPQQRGTTGGSTAKVHNWRSASEQAEGAPERQTGTISHVMALKHALQRSQSETLTDTGGLVEGPYYPVTQTDIEWTPLVMDPDEDGGWPGSYVSVLQSWKVKGAAGERNLGVPTAATPHRTRVSEAHGLLALVDSGTTLTYVPLTLYSNIWAALQRNLAAAKRKGHARQRRRMLVDNDGGAITASGTAKGLGQGLVVQVSGKTAKSLTARLQQRAARLLLHSREKRRAASPSHPPTPSASGQDGKSTGEQSGYYQDDLRIQRELELVEKAMKEVEGAVEEMQGEDQLPSDLENNTELYEDTINALTRDRGASRRVLATHDTTEDRVGAPLLRRLAPIHMADLDEQCWFLADGDTDFHHFPDMLLQFANKASYIWRPNSYLYRKGQTKVYCLTIVEEEEASSPSSATTTETPKPDAHNSSNSSRNMMHDANGALPSSLLSKQRRQQQSDSIVTQAVLGSSFFMGHDVVFDLGKWNLGLMEANCPVHDLQKRMQSAPK